MAKKTDIDQSIEDFRSKGGGSRHTIKRVLGGKLDKNGAPFHKENMQFEDENEGARIVDVVQTGTCSFGHTVDDKIRVAGVCEVGGEVLCSTEGCMLQCVECGAAVCRRHGTIYRDKAYCQRHKWIKYWRMFWRLD